MLSKGVEINFAHQSFKWNNNAANNAGVTCVIVGVGSPRLSKELFTEDKKQSVKKINPYLLPSDIQAVPSLSKPLSLLSKMNYGNLPGDGNYLTISKSEKETLIYRNPWLENIIIPLYGAQEFIRGLSRFCLWIDDKDLDRANQDGFVAGRIQGVLNTRLNSKDASYNSLAGRPHQFRDRNLAQYRTILAPTVSSATREYLPCSLFGGRVGTTNQAFALYDAPIWNLAILSSKVHLTWIATVCGKMKTDYRYSNTLGWNTFPLPKLTEKNKQDLTVCVEEILLARESHFPATMAELYDPERMPENLRMAHERNDEVLERIYIGRRFKNDTERLEKLFDLYTKMIEKNKPTIKNKRKESK